MATHGQRVGALPHIPPQNAEANASKRTARMLGIATHKPAQTNDAITGDDGDGRTATSPVCSKVKIPFVVILPSSPDGQAGSGASSLMRLSTEPVPSTATVACAGIRRL